MTDPISSSAPALPPLVGDAETLIAQAALELEECSATSREMAREARELRRDAQRDRIEDLRRAAKGALVVGLVQPVVDGAATALAIRDTRQAKHQGASNDQGSEPGEGASPPPTLGQHYQRRSGQLDGAAGGLEAIGRFFVSRRERGAEVAGNLATAAGDRAEAMDDAASSTDRLADRALGHLDELSRSRWQARLDLARG